MRRQYNLSCGFTLLELMLVSAIILTLVCFSTPLFKRTYEDLRLTSQAKEMVQALKFCREKAIFERRAYKLSIDKDKRSYQILEENEDGSQFKPLKSRWGRVVKLSEGIGIETEKDGIIFLPNGDSASLNIYLTNKQNKAYTISIEPEIGAVSLYDYKKS